MFDATTSAQNLLSAWQEFVPGKRKKPDVQVFAYRLMDNLFQLQRDLSSGAYKHGPYEEFKIADPKPRVIHKASVRDRLTHHAIYRQLYPYFDRRFTHDSFSCRLNKGTHRAIYRFQSYFHKVSKNNTRTCWVLKCDVHKFFASINHDALLAILGQHLEARMLALLQNIVESFSSASGKGLPLGNLTSQLLANVYMNEFDQFVKHRLKVKHYIRYADDFVFLSDDRKLLEQVLLEVVAFLREKLKLELHPDKVSIETFASGVDFLGWVHFPTHRVIRRATKKRMIRNLARGRSPARVESYRGLLSHGDAWKLSVLHLGDKSLGGGGLDMV